MTSFHREYGARMMNFAAATVGTDQLLFLNNDIEVLTPDWLEILLEHGQHAEVGAVGAHLAFPDGVPQHEGVLVGWGARTPAANLALEKFATPASEPHLVQELGDTVRNFSAVTGACLLIRPSVYWEVGGLDERLHIAFNDVDLGLKLRHRGYEVVYTPDAQLVHNESATRGSLHPLDNDSLFRGRWAITAEYTDPYGNPNYDPDRKFYLRP